MNSGLRRAYRRFGTLGSGNRLDDLPLQVGPHTRLDKAAGPGSYIEVRGRLDASGNVIAGRIRRRRMAAGLG